MRVLVSPEASKLISQECTTEGTKEVLAHANRIHLDRLNQAEYWPCFEGRCKYAIAKYSETTLAVYFSAIQNVAVLFDSREPPGRADEKFIDALIPLCTEFNVLQVTERPH